MIIDISEGPLYSFTNTAIDSKNFTSDLT